MVDRDFLAQTLEREAARVFEYCRALVGREDVAISVTEATLNSARSMLRDPDRLQAWLADLAYRQARASDVSDAASPSAAPSAGPAPEPGPDQAVPLPERAEVAELVYRHGIHREDLGAVLGLPADAASALLAAAEAESGRWEPPAEPDQAEVTPGSADQTSGQPALPDPDRLRAWLFALARQQALAAVSDGTADRDAPAAELARYTGGGLAVADPARAFPSASWWQDSARQRTRRRRLRLAALAAIPLAAAIGAAVYLGGVSHPSGSAAHTGASGSAGAGDPPRAVRQNAGLAAVAPHASASPTMPISVLLPVSPMPVLQPSPIPPSPAASPTVKPSPKPSPTPTPKPSAKPSPTPTPKPSAKPSPTPTPTPKSSATPKPTTTVKASATPTTTVKATATPTHTPG